MGRVRLLRKKPVFLVMDYLLTGIVIALILLAAWIYYKRWASRRRSDPEMPEEEEYEEAEAPAPPPAAKPAPPPKVESVPEPIVEEK
jgi:hypothetical protein